MNFHGKDIKIFSGNSNVDVAQGIAGCLGLQLGKSDCTHFSDGEIAVSLHESVRGSDCFIVQSTCTPVNDNLMEMLIMIDAMKRASAARITAVMPYFGYARQDRKAKARDPISAKLCADIITTAGADRVLTMDLHANQIQGFFNIPVDHLHGAGILANHMKEKIGGNFDDFIVVSPDLGSVTRSRNFASKINTGLAIIDKRRPKANVPPAPSATRQTRLWKRAAPPRCMPAQPTRCCPVPLWRESKTAPSRRLSCSTPFRFPRRR